MFDLCTSYHIKIINLYRSLIVVKLVSSVLVLLLIVGVVSPSFAHTAVEVAPFEIEAGWGVEPPIVGIRNDLVFRVIERGDNEGTFTGITNAFRDMDATVTFGGANKQIAINSDQKPGYYFSPIIPTKTGTYVVVLQGEIKGVTVDVEIPIEDVEPTALLDFPPQTGQGDTDTTALKNALSALQQDVSKLKSGQLEISVSDGGTAFDIAFFGLGIGAAGVILAIVALVKKR